MSPAPPLVDLGRLGGYAAWGVDHEEHRVRFAGRRQGGGPEPGGDARRGVLAAIHPTDPPPVAAARQVHSVRVLLAEAPGSCGDGDALVTRQPGLALSVVTADCVPLLLAAGEWVAAVHAGWRGIAGGVVAATLDRLADEGAGDPSGYAAWIGPAIASCCYEVGDEVAEAVARSSSPEVVLGGEVFAGGDTRPRLDLAAAVRHQLAAGGVVRVAWQVSCTSCDEGRLWSYRRDGAAAGRNHAFIWRRG